MSAKWSAPALGAGTFFELMVSRRPKRFVHTKACFRICLLKSDQNGNLVQVAARFLHSNATTDEMWRVLQSMNQEASKMLEDKIQNVNTLHVARDFSRFPAGRYKNDGKHSGEHLRDLVVSRLERTDKLHVRLDGVLGLGSSFLEEAFGGLVREDGFSEEELSRRLVFSGGIDEDEGRIRQFIQEAQDRK